MRQDGCLDLFFFCFLHTNGWLDSTFACDTLTFLLFIGFFSIISRAPYDRGRQRHAPTMHGYNGEHGPCCSPCLIFFFFLIHFLLANIQAAHGFMVLFLSLHFSRALPFRADFFFWAKRVILSSFLQFVLVLGIIFIFSFSRPRIRALGSCILHFDLWKRALGEACMICSSSRESSQFEAITLPITILSTS